jgi:hypothetical protein
MGRVLTTGCSEPASVRYKAMQKLRIVILGFGTS